MYPVLFRLGGLTVRSYTVLIDLGLLVGLALAYGLWRRRGHAPLVFLDAVTCALVGGVLGGRAGYVAMNWPYFSARPLESIAVWNGGMSFHGALGGGFVAVALYALLARRAWWDLADAGAWGLAAGGFFGWGACLAAGCAYGLIGEGPFFLLSPDVYGIEAPRFAVQLFGMAQSLLVVGILWLLLRGRARPGLLFAAYLLAYFGGQFFLESARGDESPSIGPLRLGQAIDLFLALAGLGLVPLLRRRGPAAPAEAGAAPPADMDSNASQASESQSQA